MPQELIVPTVLMSLALVAYSAGVWAERASRYLAGRHVAAFWLGLAFDVAGTYAMNLLSARIEPEPFHSWTGLAAFLVMAAHAVWAAAVLGLGGQRARATFHRFSLAVWLVWLVPYVGGIVWGVTSV